MDKKSFIEICNRVHNNKYEYDSIEQDDIKIRGLEEYEKRKINDKIKNNFCLQNNITLIRLSGIDYKEIEKILVSTISNLKI